MGTPLLSSLTQAPKPKGGRPAGTAESPDRMLEREVILTIKAVQEIRGVVLEQVREIKKALDSLGPHAKPEVIAGLAGIIGVLGKSIEGASKYLARAEQAPEPADTTIEDIEAMLKGGSKR